MTEGNGTPVSLRLSVTDRCQLCCAYCTPAGWPEGPQDHGQANSPDGLLPFDDILRFVRALRRHFGLTKVRLTGGEPLLRKGLAELVSLLSAEGLADLALTTNAQLLAGLAEPLRRAGLGRVNVSLPSLRPETFRRITLGGHLERTVEGIEAAIRCGLHPVKLNTVALRGVNDGELAEIARFGLHLGCEVRFLEMMPLGPAAAGEPGGTLAGRFMPSSEVLARLAEAFELTPAEGRSGGSSRDYVARDASGAAGTIGVISSCTEPFCDGCRRLRLTARGELIGCLARGEGRDIRPLLNGRDDDDALAEAVREVLSLKRDEGGFVNRRTMSSIGG